MCSRPSRTRHLGVCLSASLLVVSGLLPSLSAVAAQIDPMVQLSDLVCFASKKYLGIEAGYHDNYPKAAKDFFRELYLIIDERLIKKGIVPEEGRYAADFNNFMRQITPKPRNGWKQRVY